MSRKKVLIVDDDVLLSRTIKDGLEASGPYDVHVVNNPLHAKRMALQLRPDIMILDVVMPGKDGGTVAAEMRDEPKLAHTPFLFLTSIIGKNEASAHGGVIGDETVLAKPISIDELTEQLERLLRD